MALKIIWSPRALQEAEDILAYIGERDIEAARSLRQRFETIVLPIAEHPYL